MRRERLEQLRQRFIASNLRSRSLRLTRPTQSGALDLERLARLDAGTFAQLCGALARGEGAATSLVPLAPGAGEGRELARDLGRLAHHARADWLETGARELAVGWPLLEGRAEDGTWLRAPLLLYPVSLEETQVGKLSWQLSVAGPPDLNESLARTLRRVAGFAVSLELLLEGDDDRVLAVDDGTWRDLHATFERHGLALSSGGAALPALQPLPTRDREARDAAPKGEFALEHHLVLGRFPRADSNLVEDYDALLAGELDDATLGVSAELLAVDEALADDYEAATAPELPEVAERGATLERLRPALVLDSDSSQDAVLAKLFSGDASGLVVQGPPGTGKSQLITNVLAASVAQGKRVLLACQKRAALDVVAERLGHAGLGDSLALVHDVSRERNTVCDGLAELIDAVMRQAEQGDAAVADAPREVAAAQSELRARLRAGDAGFTALASWQSGRPPLAVLDERALDDPGHPLPDLTAVAAELPETALLDALPRIESLAAETEALAAPHPLWQRDSFADLDDAALARNFERLRALREAIATLGTGAGEMTAAQAADAITLFDEADALFGLIEEGDPREQDRFALFWGWTDGALRHGEWSRVVERLRRGQRELRPCPSELILERPDTLESWQASLARLSELQQRWYRFLTPEYWRLRRLPGEILSRCKALDTGALSKDLAAEVAELCRRAGEWQALVDELPIDHPFFDFGFDGRVEDLGSALDELDLQHRRVAAVHLLFEKFQSLGGGYARMPAPQAGLPLRSDPFLDAAASDRRRHLHCQHWRTQLSQWSGEVDAGLVAQGETLLSQAARGEVNAALEALDGILAAGGEGAEARRLDELLRNEAPWLRAFLRGWRRQDGEAPDPGNDAIWAAQRAWRQLALDGRSRRQLEAPLTDPAQLERLGTALERNRQLAGHSVRADVVARLSAAAQDKETGRSLRKLAAEARKRRRRLTLRQLVERYWTHGLRELKPVWLCTPDSVSALFPLEAGLFDLVIFDEASQCPVESALPVLLRGRSALVAGDEQQMPPSHFFSARHADEADDEEQSVLASRSLLELSRIAFPGTVLRWHYRSRHEGLIAFSNEAFYGGKLITTPRAERSQDPDDGLHWHPVDGLWEEQRNRIEAEALVARVATLLQRVEAPSVGIVTFNRRQAELIEDQLDALEEHSPEFRDAVQRDRRRPAMEQLFVRNLENVQGDERDIILISTAYGPSEAGGRVHARFGPLGQAGGEKRLNVAITRARRGVHLFCSFDPDQLEVEKSKHPGPRLLKLYLRYVRAAAGGERGALDNLLRAAAQAGGRGVALAPGGPGEAPRLGRRLRDALADALEDAGLRVTRGLGLGARRVDLAVHAPDGEGYALGIDCGEFLLDGDTLARDVYGWRFWSRMGWRMVRITPGMWLEDRERVIEDVLRRAAQ